MTIELTWLTLTALMVALYWIPYVLHRIRLLGFVGTLRIPSADNPEPSG